MTRHETPVVLYLAGPARPSADESGVDLYMALYVRRDMRSRDCPGRWRPKPHSL